MANMKQWDTEIDKLSDNDARQIYDALTTLKTWKFFDNEFRPLHLWTIQLLISLKKDIIPNIFSVNE